MAVKIFDFECRETLPDQLSILLLRNWLLERLKFLNAMDRQRKKTCIVLWQDSVVYIDSKKKLVNIR